MSDLSKPELDAEIDQLLACGTQAIERIYFQLPTLDGRRYRERVYCYEFYHQLRLLLDRREEFPVLSACGLKLNGEVDKNKHPYFGPYGPKPDFLIHVPSKPDNYAVIEVKSTEKPGFRKDVGTLKSFQEHNYRRAIYLIYGERATLSAQQVQAFLNGDQSIEIWTHSTPGQPAVRFLR